MNGPMIESADDLEDVACPSCGSDRRSPRFRGRDPSVGPGMSFQIVRCDACGQHYSSPDAVRDVRASGLRAFQGSLPHPDLLPGSFDVITMRHALEHVPSPRDVLRSAWDLLDAGGMLLVQVPNFEGFDAQYFGDASL